MVTFVNQKMLLPKYGNYAALHSVLSPVPQRLLRQHRTITVLELKHDLACIFSDILHKNARQYIKYCLRFLYRLTKNLTTQYRT